MWTTDWIIEVAEAVGQKITQDGETFHFAPVGCHPSQVAELKARGFHVLTNLKTGIEGLGWTGR